MEFYKYKTRASNMLGMGFRVKVIMHNGAEYYDSKDIAKHLRVGVTLPTTKLSPGHRIMVKPYNKKRAYQFIDLQMFDTVMNSICRRRSLESPFYAEWMTKFGPDVMKRAMDIPGLLEIPDLPVQTPSLEAQMRSLSNEVGILRKQLEAYQKPIAPEPVAPVAIVIDTFDRKWTTIMSLIRLYMKERLKVIPPVAGQSKENYCRGLWNDLIMVEVDSRLGSNLREEHIKRKITYKDLIKEKGMIDGFCSTVEKLLNFSA